MSQPTADWPSAQPLTPLEQRVHRLEAAVAALQNTHALEERVAERVTQQLHVDEPKEAETSSAAINPAIVAAVAATAVRAAMPAFKSNSKIADIPWLLIDICREAAAIFWMFIDLKHKVAWSTRLLTFILLPAILLSKWWVPFTSVPVIGELIDKIVDLVLAFVMFKALSREARRYMETRGKL